MLEPGSSSSAECDPEWLCLPHGEVSQPQAQPGWLGALAERGHCSAPQWWILRAAKCLFCQQVPNPRPKADEKSRGGKDGNLLPFETGPALTATAPKAGMASPRPGEGSGDPPQHPTQSREWGMALPVRAGMASRHSQCNLSRTLSTMLEVHLHSEEIAWHNSRLRLLSPSSQSQQVQATACSVHAVRHPSAQPGTALSQGPRGQHWAVTP